MTVMRAFLRCHALAAGLLLMFALTWTIELAYVGSLSFAVPFGLYLFLGWGFIGAALIMTGLTMGRDAVTALLKRYLRWRVGWRWYLVAFLLYPAIFAAAVIPHASWMGLPLDAGTSYAARFFGPQTSLLHFVPPPFFFFEALANGEEMGWCGYVLPRLQAHHTALGASLLLGLIWGFWHLPKYVAAADGATFGLVMVKAAADAVLYTWLYNNTRGSLLLVTILHAAANTAAFFLPIAAALAVATMLIWLAAALVTVVCGPAALSPTATKQVEV
jgi:membrane protease YdiL (CAAX protease family)